MYLIRNMTETSLKAVGVILGGKDHSTIKHGIEKIENEMQSDETLSNTINILKKKIVRKNWKESVVEFIV